jgi:hypothetical protein
MPATARGSGRALDPKVVVEDNEGRPDRTRLSPEQERAAYLDAHRRKVESLRVHLAAAEAALAAAEKEH